MNNPLFKFFSFSEVEPGDYSIMDDCKNAIFIFATKKIKINKNQWNILNKIFSGKNEIAILATGIKKFIYRI